MASGPRDCCIEMGKRLSGRGLASLGAIRATLATLAIFILAGTIPAQAIEQLGTSTGLRIPRYVSLKSDRVNLREGPSKDHRTSWVFQRAGLPVEITAEFANWRRIRDSEGAEGWVLQSLLSGRRTALVAPWKRGEIFTLHAKPVDGSPIVARLQSGVQGSVRKCDPVWCRFSGEGFDGFIQKAVLWGVYPNEQFD